METKTLEFLQWFGTYAEGAQNIRVAGAALTPELRKILRVEGNFGKYHGVMVEVVPSYEVVG